MSERVSPLKGVELVGDAKLPTLEAPTLTALLGGLSCIAWLASATQAALGLVSLWQRAVALGRFGRLWEPAEGEGGEMLARALAGEKMPPSRLRAWARGLTEAQKDAIRHRCYTELATLPARWDALQEAVVEGDAAAGALCDALWQARDDVESAYKLLRASGAEEALGEVLRAVDDDAVARLTVVAELSPVESEWLEAVSRQEPLAWWGSLLDEAAEGLM